MKIRRFVPAAMPIESLERRSLFAATAIGSSAAVASPSVPANGAALQAEIDNAWAFATTQISKSLSGLPKGKFPSHTNADGTWHNVTASDWTSGFFAGELWQAYKRTGSASIRKAAIRLTAELTPQTAARDDLGFRFLPSDGLEQQFAGGKAAKQALISAAKSKVSAFDANVGMFRSVDGRASTGGDPLANFPVLIDHTMDIELIYRAAGLAKRSDWIKMANQHMEKLETTLVRPDGSTYQWGYFNEKSGKFIDGETRQGFSNSSTWSRGQAWAIYSFTAAAESRGALISWRPRRKPPIILSPTYQPTEFHTGISTPRLPRRPLGTPQRRRSRPTLYFDWRN